MREGLKIYTFIMASKVKVIVSSCFYPPGVMYQFVINSLQQRGIIDKVNVVDVDVNLDMSPQDLGPKLVDGNILFTDTQILEHVASYICNEKCHLKFTQLIFAGFDSFVETLKSKNLTIPPHPVARMGGLFGPLMSEYIIGHIISRERKFTCMSHDQKERKWNPHSFIKCRRVNDLTIGILGIGDIGREVARVCKSLGMTVWGVTKSRVTSESASPYVDQYRHLDDLSKVLAVSDYVCNILPSTPETRGILCGDVFKHCSSKKSIFVNIGRGDVTSDQCIVKAIRNGWLGGAILDVFESEPLSTDSELWDLPGVFISPHVSAYGKENKMTDFLVDQIERYLSGRPFLYVIDWKRGY